jgi:hypothetical protein
VTPRLSGALRALTSSSPGVVTSLARRAVTLEQRSSVYPNHAAKEAAISSGLTALNQSLGQVAPPSHSAGALYMRRVVYEASTGETGGHEAEAPWTMSVWARVCSF